MRLLERCRGVQHLDANVAGTMLGGIRSEALASFHALDIEVSRSFPVGIMMITGRCATCAGCAAEAQSTDLGCPYTHARAWEGWELFCSTIGNYPDAGRPQSPPVA